MPVINQTPDLPRMFSEIEQRLRRLEGAKRFTAPYVSANPGTPQQGDVWVRSDLGKVYAYINSAVVELSTGGASGVSSASGGTGISVSPSTGAIVITNTGVTSNVAGTGISLSGGTGAVTITNSGVTSVTAGSNVSVSGSTGGVTISATDGSTTLTTKGDLLTRNTVGLIRLPVGTNGQILSADSTAGAGIAWTGNYVSSAVAGTGISVSGATGAVTITNSGVTSVTAGTGISASGSTGGVTITNSGVTSIVAGTNVSVSGSTGAVTVNATDGSTTLTTKGDLLSRSTSALVRLPVGTNGQILSADSTATSGLTWTGNYVSGVTAGTGISVSGSTGSVTVTNSGVTSAVAGTGISVSAGTGAVTITNSGVTSLTAGSNITLSGSTGAITISASGGGGGTSLPSGTITMFGGSTAPTDWLLCNGSAVSRSTYSALFTAIGTTYGAGDGSTTFNLPDFRSRFPIGAGTGTGLTARTLGASGGAESKTIASGNLPTHTHTINHDHPNTISLPAGSAHTHTTSVDPPATGSGGISANHQHYVGAHSHDYRYNNDGGSGTVRSRLTGGGGLTASGTGGIISTDYGYSGYVTSDHAHTTDIAAFNATSGNGSADHTHDVDIPNYTGSSGDGGFANTALDVMNPWLAVSFIIKT